MTDPVSRLGEIRERFTYPRPDSELFQRDRDVEWLLEHIEQLQRDITEMDSAYASKASECTDLHGLCMRQRKELAGLRSFAQSLLTLETDMKARAGAGLGTIIDQARTALGADDDR